MTISVKQTKKKEYKPFRFSSDFGQKLAERMFEDKKLAVREAITNGLDAESEIGIPEKIEITINKKTKVMTIEDWGAGLTQDNLDRFYNAGVNKEFSGHIGYFGVGRLTIPYLGQLATYYSNNGKYGVRIEVNKNPLGVADPEYGSMNDFLSHRGTKIIIENLINEINEDYIIKKIKEIFSLRMIRRGTTIIVNHKKIDPEMKFNPIEENFNYKMMGKDSIYGQLIESEQGNGGVDVYVKDIFVTHLTIDPTRLFTGWVCCDNLELKVSRDMFVTDNPIYTQFISTLQTEAKRFKKKNIDSVISKSKVLNNAMDIFNRYLKENDLIPKIDRLVPTKTGKEFTPIMNPDPEGIDRVGEGNGDGSDGQGTTQTATPTEKNQPAKKTKTNTVMIVNVEEGLDQPAIHWSNSYPQIFLNTTHPLSKEYFSHYRHGKDMFVMRYLARIAVQMNPKFNNCDETQRYTEEDRIYALFMNCSDKLEEE